MPDQPIDEAEIFNAARKIESAEARAEYLAHVCGDDEALRARVNRLLGEFDAQPSFLEHPAVEAIPTEMLAGAADDRDANTAGSRTVPHVDDIPLDFLQPSDDPKSIGRLGQYEIREVVGRGGMGIVLKAQDPKLNRVVAVKVLAPELASNVTARKRFLKEAQSAAAVSHDHIVAVIAVEEDAERVRLPYLVMEFIDGLSLQQKIDRDGPLELKEILRIGHQVAAGLSAAHLQGLIHRDVKPSNILLQNGVQRVKITDFGLARAVDDIGMTKTGEVTGTPQYMSPEQAQGQHVDPRSDLFSLGSVLYAICTGRGPFRADTTVAALRRVCDGTPRPIREINPDIPVWLVDIIDSLLQKQPEDRYQSAQEVSDLLAKCLARLQEVGPSSMTGIVVPQKKPAARRLASRPSRTRGTWLMPAMILLAVGMLLGVTEATGVTHVSATVVRIVTGEGTLVIEVDDPTVQISLDGEELSISGAGLEELRLRPGQYQFQAFKDGEPVKQVLVTITRGDRQVVRVTREGDLGVSEPRLESPAVQDALVVLSGNGQPMGRFNTLADAVRGSTAGDTIEIRGNGPFVTEPIEINHPLWIRGAEGYHPVIRGTPRNPEHDERESWPIIDAQSELFLENLELQRTRTPHDLRFIFAIQASAPLHMVNCRVCVDANGAAVWGYYDNPCSLRNCELLVGQGAAFGSSSSGNAELDNNVLLGVLSAKYVTETNHELRLKNNTLCSNGLGVIQFSPALDVRVAGEHDEPANRYHVHASGNILDHPTNVFTVVQNKQAQYPYDFDDAQAWLPRFIGWEEDGNLFDAHTAFLNCKVEGEASLHYPDSPVKTLEGWNQYWGLHNTGSSQGIVRYVGGNVREKFRADPGSVTAEDFRLRPDSAGFQAGPDGEDLGANIDFVGPGEAYERWKQTEEYQAWQVEVADLMRSDDLAPTTEESIEDSPADD